MNASCDFVDVAYTHTSTNNTFADIQNAELRLRVRMVPAIYKPSALPPDEFSTTVFSANGMPTPSREVRHAGLDGKGEGGVVFAAA